MMKATGQLTAQPRRIAMEVAKLGVSVTAQP